MIVIEANRSFSVTAICKKFAESDFSLQLSDLDGLGQINGGDDTQEFIY